MRPVQFTLIIPVVLRLVYVGVKLRCNKCDFSISVYKECAYKLLSEVHYTEGFRFLVGFFLFFLGGIGSLLIMEDVDRDPWRFPSV